MSEPEFRHSDAARDFSRVTRARLLGRGVAVRAKVAAGYELILALQDGDFGSCIRSFQAVIDIADGGDIGWPSRGENALAGEGTEAEKDELAQRMAFAV